MKTTMTENSSCYFFGDDFDKDAYHQSEIDRLKAANIEVKEADMEME